MATNQSKIQKSLDNLNEVTNAAKKGEKYFPGGRLSKEFITNFLTNVAGILTSINTATYIDINSAINQSDNNSERLDIIEAEIPIGFDYDLFLVPSDHEKKFRYIGEDNVGSVTLPSSIDLTNSSYFGFNVTLINDSPDKSYIYIIAQSGNVVDDVQQIRLNWGDVKVITWQDDDTFISSGGGVILKTEDYLAKNKDIILVDASLGEVTITLPKALFNNQVSVKKIDDSINEVILDGNGANIDDDPTFNLWTKDETVTVISNDTNYYII